jgi:hypothetical protein
LQLNADTIGVGQADRFQAVNVRRSGIILALAVLGGGLVASARVDDDPRQGFPLIPGTEWVYRGFVRSFDQDSSTGKVTPVTWTMTVVHEFERGGVSAAVVKGFPADLDWSDGHTEPQLSVLIGTPDARFYVKTLSGAGVTLDQIEDVKYSFVSLVRDDDGFLQLPLAQGKRFFCDQGAENREDSEYCWVTGAPHPVEFSRVRGVTPGARTAYEVEFSTNPDDREFEFVDGVGITSYQYHHHRTIAETELRLIEFHPAGESASR